MPPEFVPGPLAPGPGMMPTLFICASQTGAGPQNYAVTNTGSGWIWLVCGVDLTAVSVSPGGPKFCGFSANGPSHTGLFYYDSQSIGEGQGIDFAWRGMIKLEKGWTLEANFDPNGSSTASSCVAWGFVMQQPQVTAL